MDTTSAPPQLDALPVRLAVRGDQAPDVAAWVTAQGWQLVDDATEPLVPARLVLVDPAGATSVDRHGAPAVLLVGAAEPAARAARAALQVPAEAVLSWPADREALPGVAADLTALGHGAAGSARLRVCGAAGGVGTTTVALALAGSAAWRGRRALVLARGYVPIPQVAAVSAGDLASAGLWEAATPAPGVPGLRVVRVAGPHGPDDEVAAGHADLVVDDLAAGEDGDVLVCRRDAAGLRALARGGAAAIVLVDHGSAPWSAVRRAAGSRRLVTVPWSARVGRAALAHRVPAALPGSWLRTLAPVLRGSP